MSKGTKLCSACREPLGSPGDGYKFCASCRDFAAVHAFNRWPLDACPLNVKSCLRCGAAFTLRKRTTGTGARNCIDCQSFTDADRFTDKNHRRRMAVDAGEFVRLSVLAQRDSFRCQLCSAPVDMGLRHPDPMSPSIDHIIPLSKGGEHTMANTQLAHLHCNMSKGNRPAGEQLRLVG